MLKRYFLYYPWDLNIRTIHIENISSLSTLKSLLRGLSNLSETSSKDLPIATSALNPT
jgi:hypothetical protein